MYQYAENYARSTENSHIAMDYFSSVARVAIEDHTQDKKAQGEGWDFMFNGRYTEFKDCARIHETGNMVFELVSNSRKGTPGCLIVSRASLLCYYDTVGHIAHLMGLQQLKTAIEKSPRTRWEAYKITTPIPGSREVAYATFGLLVPLTFIKGEKGVFYRTYDLSEFVSQQIHSIGR